MGCTSVILGTITLSISFTIIISCGTIKLRSALHRFAWSHLFGTQWLIWNAGISTASVNNALYRNKQELERIKEVQTQTSRVLGRILTGTGQHLERITEHINRGYYFLGTIIDRDRNSQERSIQVLQDVCARITRFLERIDEHLTQLDREVHRGNQGTRSSSENPGINPLILQNWINDQEEQPAAEQEDIALPFLEEVAQESGLIDYCGNEAQHPDSPEGSPRNLEGEQEDSIQIYAKEATQLGKSTDAVGERTEPNITFEFGEDSSDQEDGYTADTDTDSEEEEEVEDELDSD